MVLETFGVEKNLSCLMRSHKNHQKQHVLLFFFVKKLLNGGDFSLDDDTKRSTLKKKHGEIHKTTYQRKKSLFQLDFQVCILKAEV